MMELIKTLLSYGTVPAILVLAWMMSVILRKLAANEQKGERRDEAQRLRDEELKDYVSTQLAEADRRNQTEHKEQAERIDGVIERVTYLEKDYLPRGEHYRDFSGWRGEIRAMNSKLDKVLLAFGRILGGRKG